MTLLRVAFPRIWNELDFRQLELDGIDPNTIYCDYESSRTYPFLCHRITCTNGCAHKFSSTLYNRTHASPTCICPICANRKKNACVCRSLRENFPNIYNQIHFERAARMNIDVTYITAHSHQRLPFICPIQLDNCTRGCRHIWYAVVNGRTSRNDAGCPYCAGKKVCRCIQNGR